MNWCLYRAKICLVSPISELDKIISFQSQYTLSFYTVDTFKAKAVASLLSAEEKPMKLILAEEKQLWLLFETKYISIQCTHGENCSPATMKELRRLGELTAAV